MIPVKPEVYEFLGIPDVVAMLKAGHAGHGYATTGWVFPKPDVSGHLHHGVARKWGETRLEGACFEPYCLRHTCRTWSAPYLNGFKPIGLMGDGSLTQTLRDTHLGSGTLKAGFRRLARTQAVPSVSTTKSLRRGLGSPRPLVTCLKSRRYSWLHPVKLELP